MNVCETCAGTFDGSLQTCPRCAGRVGRILARPLTAPRAVVDITMEVLKKLDRRWSMGAHGSGWRMVELVARTALVFVLVALAIATHARLDEAAEIAQRRLETHRALLAEGAAAPREELAGSYERLLVSAQELVEAQILDGRRHVLVMLAFLALLATSVIGKLRGHKEYNKIKAALNFLVSPDARPFVEQIWRSRSQGDSR